MEEVAYIYGANYLRSSINKRRINIGEEKVLYTYKWESVDNYLYLKEYFGVKWQETIYRPGDKEYFPSTYTYGYYEVVYVKRNTGEKIREITDKEEKRLNNNNFNNAVKNF